MDHRTSVALLRVKSLCMFIRVLPENSVVCHCWEAISDQIQEQPSLCVSIAFLNFFFPLGWQLLTLLSPENSLQLGRVDQQCMIYTGLFQRGSRKERGEKNPAEAIHPGVQVKDPSLYFRLIFLHFSVTKSISVEFAVIIF